MKRYTTIAILASSLFVSQAMAANKPIHGKYTCKGTADQEVNVSGVGAGSREFRIKGKLTASRGSFTAWVKSKEWKSIIAGYLEPDMQKVTLSSMNRTYKEMTSGCSISGMWQAGAGHQIRTGRTVYLNLSQGYHCGRSDVENVDRYRLTCKR